MAGMNVDRKVEPWMYWIALAVVVIGLVLITNYQQAQQETEIPSYLLIAEQEYTISELLDIQKTETVYLIGKDGALVMGNIYLSQARDSSSGILTGVTYHPKQLVLIASYGSNGEMLQEQVMGKNKYPNVPAEDPAVVSNPMFGRYKELEINAYAMELPVPHGTETIKMYSNG